MNDRTQIKPDAVYPNLWRVHYPDGTVSDLLNRIRALEAVRIFENGGITRGAASPPDVVIPADALVLVVTPAGACGQRHGQIFNAHLGDRLIVRSGQPFLDAARILIGEGVDPDTTMVIRHDGSKVDSLVATVGTAAALTVDEGDSNTGRPRFVTWKAFSTPDVWSPVR